MTDYMMDLPFNGDLYRSPLQNSRSVESSLYLQVQPEKCIWHNKGADQSDLKLWTAEGRIDIPLLSVLSIQLNHTAGISCTTGTPFFEIALLITIGILVGVDDEGAPVLVQYAQPAR